MGNRKNQIGENGGITRAKQAGRALALCLLAGTSTSWAQVGGAGSSAQPPQDFRNPVDRGDELSHQIKVTNMIVDLHVQDEDLATVLQMLSIQTQKNIITGKDVKASVTANLYGVTFYEALDAILHANGYGYVEQGNFITIYTSEELKAFQDANRVKEWKIIRLDYLNAVDAAAFVQALLSPDGTITTNAKAEDFNVPSDSPGGGEDFALGATMVVVDWQENVDAISSLIDELDTKPVQVLVQAVVLHTTLTEANAWGIDVSILGSMDFNDFIPIGSVLQGVDALLGGNGTGSVTGGDGPHIVGTQATGGTGPGTAKLGFVSGDVAVFIRMLDEVSDTRIVSRPNILTLNRQSARVLVGRKVGYLSTTATQTSTTQTVEFLDTGTQLYFRPFVSSDGMIRMELKPQISEAVIRNATDATGAAVTIPDEITNEITTNVMVRDGQTIVLGGLLREASTASRRQIPFLGDLAIIGGAFRGNEDATERSEIIFMITPSIINDAQLIAQAERASSKVRQVRSGFRAGLLPWSREKQSSQLIVEAERQALAGKLNRALNMVQRSLQMFPYQFEAIALRERLMNEEAVWPRRNMMHDIIHGELQQMLESIPVEGDAGDDGNDDQMGAAFDEGSFEFETPFPAAAAIAVQEEELRFPFVETEPTDRAFMDEEFAALTDLTESTPSPTSGVLESEPEWLKPDVVEFEPEAFDPFSVSVTTPGEPEAVVVDAKPVVNAAEPVDDGRLDFSFKNEDLQTVLQTLSREFHENVIFGDDVRGKVTAQLYDVSFEEALGAILLANGYEAIDRGSFIEIRPNQPIEPAAAKFRPTTTGVAGAGAGQHTEPVENNVAPAGVGDLAAATNWDELFERTASEQFWGKVFWSGWVNHGLEATDAQDVGPVSVDPTIEDGWFRAVNDPYGAYWMTPITGVNDEEDPNR